jgi:hypothetical protein
MFSSGIDATARPMITQKHSRFLTVAICLVSLAAVHAGVPSLQSYQAKNHIGETATVCGLVVSSKYAEASHRSPTFLNLDRAYPQQPFTIVIWGADRAKFGKPEANYADKRVCVTGTITEYRGKPEIIATDPSQIQAQ